MAGASMFSRIDPIKTETCLGFLAYLYKGFQPAHICLDFPDTFPAVTATIY